MIVRILSFGIAKEILGSATTTLSSHDLLTAESLKAELELQYPRLKQLTSFMIAINGEYAGADTIVKPGDEVAIIPPVSGG